MKIESALPLRCLLAAFVMPVIFSACSSGRVFTVSGNPTAGFGYQLPSTLVEIDLPVKIWTEAEADEFGDPKKPASYTTAYFELALEDDSPPPLSTSITPYGTKLSLIVQDNLGNTASLDKFDVSYFTTGATENPESTGIIKTINSEVSDKTAIIAGNYTNAVIELGKLALRAQGVLQAAGESVPYVILSDRIKVSLPLSAGADRINAALSKEIQRVKNKFATKSDSAFDIVNENNGSNLRGIRELTFTGTVSGWPSAHGHEFILSEVAKGDVLGSNSTVKLKRESVINGVVYPDPENASFTLSVGGVSLDDDSNKVVVTDRFRITSQIPEAGTLRVLPVNPKTFGERKLSVEFAQNGKLIKWGYTATSRAEQLSAFLKDEATTLNAGGDALLTQYQANRVDMAKRRANVQDLEVKIRAKEGELLAAKHEKTAAEQAKNHPAEGADKAALELAFIQAEVKVRNVQAELAALRQKRPDVAKGLIEP